MIRFYGYFAACYGTFWFCLLLAAIVTQKHINAGPFGLYGFPIIAFFYAILRSLGGNAQAAELVQLRERVRLLEEQLWSVDDDRYEE